MLELSALIKRIVICLILGLSVTSCRKTDSFDQELRGRALSSVVIELGTPVSSVTFPLSTSLLEFQYGLLYTATPQEVATHVQVKQILWSRWPGKLYVWFIYRKNKWVAVDSLYWGPGVQF
ncbi:hypothetical protein CDA63_19895 [Hymenobacter amundsenii]|uniref:Uncharacterized protein n=1 Tax=Hymenobacter amundsenii TaxID=2006685 RepID=A0A246FFQ4_9BACT|nr:hypothetical protein CDA63_19895 [Hymenobacter amundsenii]